MKNTLPKIFILLALVFSAFMESWSQPGPNIASVILEPGMSFKNPGDTVTVSIRITGDHIRVMDLYLDFDHSVLARTSPGFTSLLPGSGCSFCYRFSEHVSHIRLTCCRIPGMNFNGERIVDLKFIYLGGRTGILVRSSPGPVPVSQCETDDNPGNPIFPVNFGNSLISGFSFSSLTGPKIMNTTGIYRQDPDDDYFKLITGNPDNFPFTDIVRKVSRAGDTGISPGVIYYRQVAAPRNLYKINLSGTRSDTVPLNPLCDVVTLPFGPETFGSPAFPPACWTRFSGLLGESTTLSSTSLGWTADNWLNIPGGDPSAKISIRGTNCNYWLMTPQIDLGGTANPTLEFDLGLSWWDPSAPPPSPGCQGVSGTDDKFAVVISTDGGITWTSANILRLWDNAGSAYVYDSIAPHGEHVTISLEGFSGTIMIGFYGESSIENTENDLMIDNVSITPSANSKTMHLALFLEGLYSGNGMMNQAYDEQGPHFGEGIADLITVELHEALNPANTVFTFSNANLTTTGEVTIGSIPLSISGSYYIVIKHRNSIETWSSLPVLFTGPGNISYDFSGDAAQTYGGNMKQTGDKFLIWAGDVNQDGIADGADMSMIFNASMPPVLSGYNPQDLNGDGVVDGADMSMIFNNSKPPPVQVIKP